MGTAINLDEIKRFEVTEVYSHPDAKVDIVLVHGLNGDPRRTWTATGNGTYWPTQLLPVSLKSAQARVLVYGYNADVYTFGSGKSASSDMIHHHAQTLIANLALERKSEEVEEHPIIFVAHSLGGILVKRALELSNDLQSKNADDNRSIFVSTYGIVFLGTPHNGADPAKWGVILQGMVSALVPKKVLHSESQLVKTLQSNNETLQNINLHFLDIYQKFKVCMVHEAAPTDLKGTKAFVVDKDSAAPLLPDVQYFGIEATHSGMCKFESKNSPGYTNVSETIRGWVKECGPVIQARWENERRQRWQIRQAQAAELLGTFPMSPQGSTNANTPSTWQNQQPPPVQQYRQPGLVEAPSPSRRFEFEVAEVEENEPEPLGRHPSNSMNNSTIIVKSTANIEPQDAPGEEDAYFIKPSGFRPNSLFVGRQTELAELHKMLFDKKRRGEGTSAVLVQSMPGGGKTHLARQYVYDYKKHFPGGIFWLRAKSSEELAAGFWDIARKAALKHLVEAEEVESTKQDPENYVKLVRRWMNHQRDWLLVLDGIHFNDAENIRRFIPDSVGTGLIYTSTEKSVSGNHLFMNPQIIKLPLLSAREAQQLLLLELDRKKPFSKDDLKHSMELVQSMGFLPVVIHAVAQRLKSTDEPLAKFARNYSNEPRLRGLGTYMAVVEQLKKLGAYETLNLIYILSFFSQHIPVEMIALGLRALESPQDRIPVKACEPVSGSSLNNTFKVLNTFALIERNEHENSMSSSQSSKGSRDMLAENVDVIRLHSVVQGFFLDTLLANGTLFVWLDRAVRVFCCSYDVANERITRKTNAGLVEDYRVYEIHGIRIREQLTKHLSKHLRPNERIMLEEAQRTLESRLEAIKSEIERRTPESSHVIAGGKPDVFQTSIFDRTSSSSDTGPETPGVYDNYHPHVSTWGLEHDMGQNTSPSSLTHDPEINRQQLQEIYRTNFPLPMHEDDGYESDREGSTAMTVQYSQRTIQASSPLSPGGQWETVINRRQKPKLDRLDMHRSIRNMEKQRYRDSAGAYRSLNAVDPRVSKETAQGYLQKTANDRDQSRGRMSGQSIAEVALAHISKNSPPPARGGGMIQDRRPVSQVGRERGRMMTGLSSYAAAVAGSTKDTILGWKDSSRPSTADAVQSSSESNSTVERPQSSAIESLQRFPIETVKSSPPLKTGTFTPMPPYPTSPIERPPTHSGAFPFPKRYSQENQTLDPKPHPSTIYPRMEGPPPFENLQSNIASSSSSPRFPPASISQAHSEYIPSDHHSSPPLSLSFPDIKFHLDDTHNSLYYPGRPELSNQKGGYSSQPMSRDPSGHSNQSAPSASMPQRRRRTSLAETEPPPQLPIFTPRIPPTSYQVYEHMRRMEEEVSTSRLTREDWEKEANSHHGMVKKSPGLEYARSALIERLDEWNTPSLAGEKQLSKSLSRSPPRRKFNPTAPSFSPLPSMFTYPHSPGLPPAPPNSILSNNSSTTYNSANVSMYPSPLPPQPPNTTPQSFHSFTPPNTRPKSTGSDGLADSVEMGRSGSGGVKMGGRVIEFGDFPEKVDADAARERVMNTWRERERFQREERATGLGLDLSLSIDPRENQILERIRLEVLTSTPGLRATNYRKVHTESKFRVGWNLRDFMHRQFRDSSVASMGSVIVLNGTSLNAQATTCKDYLRSYWPNTSPTLLECLEDDGIDGSTSITKGDGLELRNWMEGEELILEAGGTGEQIIEVAQQLAWLGAALRHSPDDGLKYSEAKISTVQGRKPVFDISFSMSPLNKDESSCWHSLFTNSVIAKGFPIAERGQEIGLEIPLEMMAALTGVRHAVEYEGGILLKGHSSAFLPVKRYKDSIQWHYIEDDENVRLPYGAVGSRCPGRAMLGEVDMDSLKTTRAFVGWWGTTETHLGTDTANYGNIDFSPAYQAGRSMKFSGATVGFQQILIGEIGFSLGARDGKLHVQRKGPYQRIVQCAARSPVVLYDFCEKRAWLVPSSAVILHIARTRHYRNPFINDGEDVTFPSADPSKSNHEAAEKVLLEQAPFKLSANDDLGNQDYYLRDLVRDIWSLLEGLLDKVVTKESTSEPELRGTLRALLRGWEFMDLVDEKSPFRLKETHIEKSSGGWTDLARDIDAVILFGSGFEDIIKPNEESMIGLCHAWKSVPKGKDYLTASVPMMNHLYEQAGSKLSRKHLTSTHLRWHHGGQLWERCEFPKSFSCSCNRLQQVVSEHSAQLSHVLDPGPLEVKGAVIFGQASDPVSSAVLSLLKPKVKQDGSLYGQPNVDLLNTESFRPTGSNLSSETRTSSTLSVSVSTLPTSDDDEEDPRFEGASASIKINENDERIGRIRSQKQKTTGDDQKLPLRRKGHLTGRSENDNSVQRNSAVTAIWNR